MPVVNTGYCRSVMAPQLAFSWTVYRLTKVHLPISGYEVQYQRIDRQRRTRRRRKRRRHGADWSDAKSLVSGTAADTYDDDNPEHNH